MTKTDVDDEMKGDLEPDELTCVGLYMVDRRLGGPEEGSWTYETGDLVCEAETYRELGATKTTFLSHAEAAAFIARLEPQVNKLNAGRPDIGSVLSRGRYQLISFEGPTLPSTFPQTRPVYE